MVTMPSTPIALWRLLIVLAILSGWLAGCRQVAPPAIRGEIPPAREELEVPVQPEPIPAVGEVDDPRFVAIEMAAQQEIASGQIPGAVILVGHRGKIVYRRAFGNRALLPRVQPMTADAIFDIASLTKTVATTMAVMQLMDRGRLGLDVAAAKYWPEFSPHRKGRITIRQLLTHTSGLRAAVNSRVSWSGYQGALAAITGDRPVNPPGTAFRYSDANFIVLGEIVRRVSGLPLDVYCQREIFQPLGMKDTSFRPRGKQSRAAPSDVQNGELRWGEVQDPTAYRMGGVAGHAGVFSTADDLAVLAQMLLDGGVRQGRRLLSEGAITAMTKPHRLPGNAIQRGLGWDMRSPFSREHNSSFPAGSFGHTGYTGTSIWIEPRSKTFLIILTNRLHPGGRGQVKPLRAKTAAAVARAVPMGPPVTALILDEVEGIIAGAGQGQSDNAGRVRPGIEVLAASGFAPLRGKNIGVITNHTGLDGSGQSTVTILRRAPGVKVRALFSPEHGLAGQFDAKVSSGRDPVSGLPVYSLYGDVKRPTPQMLRGLDALVYDIQDVGARFYTYITTMAYAMEAAAAQGVEFYVLDRPNPLTSAIVQGPVLDPGLKSFIGYYPLPVRYGLTCGELALLFNRENAIGARLQVVRMADYRREAWFDQTGLPWVNPSPNLRSLTQAILYPGVALVEAANVSVGRGTARPFEVVGAPWIAGERLAWYLSRRDIRGVVFEFVTFVPEANRFRGQRCEGVRLRLEDRAVLDAPMLGIELAAALHHLHPGTFQLDRTLGMMGDRQVLQAIKKGEDPRDIKRRWQSGLEAFGRVRARYLLY